MNNYRHSGERIEVTAAGVRTEGAIVADLLAAGGTAMAGIATAPAVNTDRYWIAVSGVFVLTVPGSTAAGVLLYVPGAPPTAGNALVLTATSSSNTLFCKTLSAASATNTALCKLLEMRT